MNAEHLITIIGAVFICNGFWEFLIHWWESKHSAKTVTEKAVLALLHDKLYYLCEKHINAGYITVDEFDNLTYLYEPYKEMGGNGTCEQLYNDCKKLPKRKEVE